VIARSIARQTGQQVHPNLLVRVRRTQSLGGLGRAARAREVRGVFALNTRLDLPDVRGREVLLVDDVYTTGATANACARLLKRKGARSVHILCWARVLQDRFEH
jgi:predicted amidophosphoribosyltransferase